MNFGGRGKTSHRGDPHPKRPAGQHTTTVQTQFDQAFNAIRNEMFEKKKTGISHNEIPTTVIDLKNSIEYLHGAKQSKSTPVPNTRKQKPSTPSRKGTERKGP
ncbi:hypothetical protein CEXT_80171 [Caerostris extrusa]|uniref:Uncharacterized protein n=1 Tax=Caerostris extrusa TaxID=172846 RepID=A0AAV4WXZ0_CAEEX|nr:hypothetical protein CEXT_80171 [Caerostris extrusa]